ncbi:MAG: type 4a pilus biogenesis protein PilO, partial [Deltaproteobacteria bacterium]|nr:type 4a pilus biogenesis protein PilO [Deltaproteobacteria bacterium]
MNKLTEKQLLVLTIGVVALLTGGLGFLIWNDLENVKEEEQKVADIRTQIDSAQREIDQIQTREYRVIANREKSEQEVSFLPSATEIENFWQVIERFAEESGVHISAIVAKGDGRSSRRRGKRKVSTIASVPQVLTLTGTTNEFLRFLNMIENYDRIINVVEYRLGAGTEADPDGQVRHTIQMTMATFTYSKKVVSTIVSIANYDKKKGHPEVKKWLSRIKIQERESYTLRASMGRRDPFKNVRKPAIPSKARDGVDRATQEAMLDTLVEEVRSLEEGLAIEAHLRKVDDLFRLSQQIRDNRSAFSHLRGRINEVKTAGVIQDRDLTERFRVEVLEPFAKIESRMVQSPEAARAMSAEQVKEWLDLIGKAFDDRKWAVVKEKVQDFVELTKSGKHVDDDARALAQTVIEHAHRAKVIQVFEKRKIKISTILYSPNAMSVAIINGKQLGEGDALDADGRVLVVEIGENYVIF